MTGFRGWLVETEKRAGFPPMPKGLSPKSEKVDLGQEDRLTEKNKGMEVVKINGHGNESQWNEKIGMVNEKPFNVKAEK